MEKVIEAIDKIKSEEDLGTLNTYIVNKLREIRRSRNIKASLKFYNGASVKLKPEDIKGKGNRLYGKTGKITKMGHSKASCDFGDEGIWTIPFNMLQIAKNKKEKGVKI